MPAESQNPETHARARTGPETPLIDDIEADIVFRRFGTEAVERTLFVPEEPPRR